MATVIFLVLVVLVCWLVGKLPNKAPSSDIERLIELLKK